MLPKGTKFVLGTVRETGERVCGWESSTLPFAVTAPTWHALTEKLRAKIAKGFI